MTYVRRVDVRAASRPLLGEWFLNKGPVAYAGRLSPVRLTASTLLRMVWRGLFTTSMGEEEKIAGPLAGSDCSPYHPPIWPSAGRWRRWDVGGRQQSRGHVMGEPWGE